MRNLFAKSWSETATYVPYERIWWYKIVRGQSATVYGTMSRDAQRRDDTLPAERMTTCTGFERLHEWIPVGS